MFRQQQDGVLNSKSQSFFSRLFNSIQMPSTSPTEEQASFDPEQSQAHPLDTIPHLPENEISPNVRIIGKYGNQEPSSSISNTKPQTAASGAISNPISPSRTSQVSIPFNEKTAEQVEDEAEDALIRVMPASYSLLSETRPSFPVLRFSAGSLLVDQLTLNHIALPVGFMWTPFGRLNQISSVSHTPSRCGTCGSFLARANGATAVLSGLRKWICAFCGRNGNEGANVTAAELQDPSIYPELHSDSVTYEHSKPNFQSERRRGAIVLVVDENLEKEESRWAKAAVAAVHIAAAEEGLRFALLTVGSGCSVAFGGGDEETVPKFEMMSVSRASRLAGHEKEPFFLKPPKSVVEGTTNSSGTYEELAEAPTDVFITFREPSSLGGHHFIEENASHEAVERTRMRLPADVEPRRLDIAIRVAFELISDVADSESSRVLSLITGAPTLSEHIPHPTSTSLSGETPDGSTSQAESNSLELSRVYEQIGSQAGDLGVALDFLCFGASGGFAGEVLLGAAKRSRGGLLYSAAHSFSAASALAEAAVFLAQRFTSPGVVSVSVSSPLTIARVIGPAFPTAAQHTYAVPDIDPTTGFCVILTPKPNLDLGESCPTFAVVQLAAKSVNSTRVVTVRVPLVKTEAEYLNSLDSEICALVLGKACLVSGGALTQPSLACRSLDSSAQRLLMCSDKTSEVVRLLFELRRGLLLRQHVHPDVSLVLRSFFLRSECSLSSLLMSPRFFTNAMSDDRTGLMAEVPLEKMYLRDDAVLVLDTGFNVFLYAGSKASQQDQDGISESARSVAANRISPCQLWKVSPGEDAEYLLDAYLSSTGEMKKSQALEPVDRGFLPYCASLAGGSKGFKALQSAYS